MSDRRRCRFVRSEISIYWAAVPPRDFRLPTTIFIDSKQSATVHGRAGLEEGGELGLRREDMENQLQRLSTGNEEKTSFDIKASAVTKGIVFFSPDLSLVRDGWSSSSSSSLPHRLALQDGWGEQNKQMGRARDKQSREKGCSSNWARRRRRKKGMGWEDAGGLMEGRGGRRSWWTQLKALRVF